MTDLEKAAEAHADEFDLEDHNPVYGYATHERREAIRGFLAGARWALERAAEVAQSQGVTNVRDDWDRGYNSAVNDIGNCIRAIASSNAALGAEAGKGDGT